MNIKLLSLPDSQLAASLNNLAMRNAWTITELRANDSTFDFERSMSAILVIIDASNKENLDSFVSWQQSIFIEKLQFIRFLVFTDSYDHNEAINLSKFCDVQYLLLPESQEQLEAYITNTLGTGGDFYSPIHTSTNNFFAQLIDFSAIISFTDKRGAITYANDNFCQVSGYSRDELIDQNHRVLKSGNHPDNFYADMWKAISSGQPWRGIVCNRRKDDGFYWVDSTIYPILDQQQRPQAYVSIRYEVTNEIHLKEQLQISNDRFNISHAYANVGSWDWNIETGELYWSPEIHKLFGYSEPVLETTYENFLNAVHPDDRHVVVDSADACIKEGVDYKVEHRVIHPDGTIKWLSGRGHVTRDENGKATHMLGVVADIHELKEAQEKALEAEQLKSMFISTLTHEIRNPLNAMRGYSRLIAHTSDSPEPIKYSRKISKLIKHVTGILDDINFMAKLESGQIIQHPEPVLIATLVDESLEMLSPFEGQINIVKENLDHWAFADERHLKQIITNLLSNAIKYNHENGRVNIRAKLIADNLVRIEVEDTGIGISDKNLQHIFKPYERLDWKQSEIDGLGLGLSICKHLIQGMGGTIGVESHDGEGSLFWVDLPQVEESATLCPVETNLLSFEKLPNKALVLEDNIFNQEVMVEQLTSLGIKTDIANNGIEGLERIEKNRYDIVLTDINMPVMDGITFIKKLRQHASEEIRTTPAVIITAHASGAQKYKDVDCSGFLVKPFSLDQLTKSLVDFSKKQAEPTLKKTAARNNIINSALMEHYLGEDQERKKRLLSIFKSTLEKDIAQLIAQAEQKNYEQIGSISHRLASSSLSVGAESFSRSLRLLEKNIKNDDLSDLDRLLDSITSMYQKLLLEINELLNQNLSAANTQSEKINLLIVDDEPFAIEQLSESLSGFDSVLSFSNSDPHEALETLKEKTIDVIILDLNMPNMDGIQFIRHLSAFYNNQAVVIYSGETSVINSVADLIVNYGMHYLGVLEKPCSKLGITRILHDLKANNGYSSCHSTVISNEDIRHCIAENRIKVMYQPQISLATDSVTSVESLSRLVTENGEIISPNLFLPKLDQLGLEHVFASKVAEQAIRQISLWQQNDLTLDIAINFSMDALENINLPDELTSYCEKYGIESHRIIIEVTESALSTNPELASEVLVRLKLKGFNLSIDDFGTGYSSLDKLKKLPFTEIKLDKSYVSAADQDEVSMALLTSSLNLAQQLKMRTVAEGIETVEDFETVKRAGADFVQGFYLAKPMDPEDFVIWHKEFHHA